MSSATQMTGCGRGLNLDGVCTILFNMGIMHWTNVQRGVVYTVWDGAVTWMEWKEHASALITGPDWRRSSRFVVDMRSVTNTSFASEQVEQASALFTMNRLSLTGKRGAIIAQEEFRNARKFESLIAPTGIAMVVFNSLDTACLFLGLDFAETHGELERLRMQLRGN
jgi:hypothetical protein